MRPTAPALPFEGPLSALAERVVRPLLPPPDALLAWTEALLAYHHRPDAPLVVRGRPRGEVRVEDGRRVVRGDNAPGRWCWLRAADGTVSAADGADLLARGLVPVALVVTREEKSRWTWPCRGGLGAADTDAFTRLQVKHCHVLPVGERALPLVAASLRNLAPVNHFLFPSPKHHAMARLGWRDAAPGDDLGESERVIAWVRWTLLDHVGPDGRRLLERFTRAALGPPLPSRPPLDGEVRIVPRDTSAAVPAGARRPSSPAPPWRRWTLDTRRGDYFSSQIHEPVLWLHLHAGVPGRPPTEVGHFRLDLGALEARNLVKRVLKEERPRWLVRIVRDGRGVFHLARNDGASEPLERHRVGADAVPAPPPTPRPTPVARPRTVRREAVTVRRAAPLPRVARPAGSGPRCRLCGAPAIPGDEVCLDCGE